MQGKRKAAITLTSDHADGHELHAATLDDEVGHAMRANEVVGSSTASSLAGCILDALWEKMMAVVDTLEKGYDPFTTVDNVEFNIAGMVDNVPSWDDVSLWVTTVEMGAPI